MERRADQDGVGAGGQAILERLARLEVAEGACHDRMVLFPVFGGSSRSVLDYRVLGEAIADGSVEVTEQPSASVPELILVNRGKSMVFVLDGEEIVGGQQNRIVNSSFLVAPGTKAVLPVSCVEHGRWHSTSASFRAGEALTFRMKEAKQEYVMHALKVSGRHVADQGAIWGDIAMRKRRRESTLKLAQ